MLLPRFTLRSVLWGVSACAVVALVAGQAVAGQVWAEATLAAVGGAVLFFVIYALSFILVQMMPFDGQPRPVASEPRRTVKSAKPVQTEPPRSLA